FNAPGTGGTAPAYSVVESNPSVPGNPAVTIAIRGGNLTAGCNVGAWSEVGERSDSITSGGALTGTVWWTWTAPCTFSVTSPTSFIDTIGSNFDTVLGVFTGSSVNALTRFASDGDSGGSLTS